MILNSSDFEKRFIDTFGDIKRESLASIQENRIRFELGGSLKNNTERNKLYLEVAKFLNIALKPSYRRRTNDSHEDKFPYRNGDFKIEFRFNKNERLYFNGEMSDFVEYNIGKLLTNK